MTKDPEAAADGCRVLVTHIGGKIHSRKCKKINEKKKKMLCFKVDRYNKCVSSYLCLFI